MLIKTIFVVKIYSSFQIIYTFGTYMSTFIKIYFNLKTSAKNYF